MTGFLHRGAGFAVRLYGMYRADALIRSAALTFGVQVCGVALAYLLQVALARAMTPDDYGVFNYVRTWAGILAVFGALGLPTGMLRYLPAYAAAGQWGLHRGLLRLSWTLTLAGSLCIALVLIGALAAAQQAGAVFPYAEYAPALLAGTLMIPLTALVNLNTELFRAERKPVLAFGSNMALVPLLTLALVAGAALWLGQPDSAAATLLANAALLMALAAQMFVSRGIYAAHPEQEQYRAREWLAVSLPLLFIAFANATLRQIDIVMVGIVMTPEDVGIYNAAARTAGLATLVAFAINSVTIPSIASLHAQGDHAGLQRLAYRAIRWTFFPTLALAATMIVLAEPILRVFGARFVTAQPAFVILTLTSLLDSSFGAVSNVMNLTGHQIESALISAVCVAGSALLNALLIPRFGLTGAALTTLLTVIVWNAWLHRRVTYHLGVRASVVHAIGDWRRAHQSEDLHP